MYFKRFLNLHLNAIYLLIIELSNFESAFKWTPSLTCCTIIQRFWVTTGSTFLCNELWKRVCTRGISFYSYRVTPGVSDTWILKNCVTNKLKKAFFRFCQKGIFSKLMAKGIQSLKIILESKNKSKNSRKFCIYAKTFHKITWRWEYIIFIHTK